MTFTQLVWKKILMDWWDTGKVKEPVAVSHMIGTQRFNPTQISRDDWQQWVDQYLHSHVHPDADIDSTLETMDGPIDNHYTGLCYGTLFLVPNFVRVAMFHQWEHFSGNLSFPVPGQYISHPGTIHESVETDPELVYCYGNGKLYKGEYGKKRMHLKQYTVDTVRAAITWVERDTE